VTVHSAGIQDRDGGKMVLEASRARYPYVTRAFAEWRLCRAARALG
jgi:hypothetical protein